MVRAAAHNFVQTSDNALMEEMLTRKWEIYTKESAGLVEQVEEPSYEDYEAFATLAMLKTDKDSSAKSLTEGTNYREIPDTLLVSVLDYACLSCKLL